MLLDGFRMASEKWAVLSSLLCGSVVIEGCFSWPDFGLRVLRGRAEHAFQSIITDVTEFVWPETCQRYLALLPREEEDSKFVEEMGAWIPVVFTIHNKQKTTTKLGA